MHCDECQNMMFDYLLGTLPESEQFALRDHLASGCPTCAAHLAEAQTVLGHLPLALPQESPPEVARDRVMRQVLASKSAAKPVQKPQDRTRSIMPTMPPRRSWLVPILSSGIAALLAVIVTFALMNQAMERQATDLATVKKLMKSRDLRLKKLEDQIDEVIVAASSPSVRFVRLEGTADQPTANGRLLWDTERHTWHVFIDRMADAPKDRVYHLWIVTADDRKFDAGTFNLGEGGRAIVSIDLPDDLENIAMAAITDEPIGGSRVPTGSFQMLGKFN